MTVVEYIRNKNKILEKITGITLVPEDQIVDTGFRGKMSTDSDSDCCPYCKEFSDNYHDSCAGCPMATKDNKCFEGKENTYYLVDNELCKNLNGATISRVEEIKKLVDRWNQEL